MDHTAVKGAKALSISTEKNEVSYKISPSIGVMKEDVKLPMFECFTSQNVTKAAPELSQNKPLEVVDYDVKDGVMTVLYKKNADYVGKSIGTTGSAHGEGKLEKFWMASLKTLLLTKT